MSATHQYQRSTGTGLGYELAGSAEVSSDVVSDIRNCLVRPETPAITFRQEVVADLLTARGAQLG